MPTLTVFSEEEAIKTILVLGASECKDVKSREIKRRGKYAPRKTFEITYGKCRPMNKAFKMLLQRYVI